MSLNYIVALYLLLAHAVVNSNNNQRTWNRTWRTQTHTHNGRTQTRTNVNVKTNSYRTQQNTYHYQYQYQFHRQYQWQGYQFTGLNWHNKFRSAHGAQGMSLDANLNQRAQACANYYANLGTIDHSCNMKNGAGENLYMILGRVAVEGQDAVTRAVNSWYNEKKLYTNYNVKNGMSHATGHYTQLIWKNTRQMGVGVASVRGKTAVVVLYYPPGNYIGQFDTNVRPPTYHFSTING